MCYADKKFMAVAHHEGGHAVFAVLTEIPFTEVEIYRDIHPTPAGGATLGQVILDWEWPEWAFPGRETFDRKRAMVLGARDICMTLAGPMAESLYVGRWQHADFVSQELLSDEECIRTLGELLWLSPEVMRRWTARLSFVTLEVLHIPAIRQAVTRVANELFQKQSLPWERVSRLVSDSLREQQVTPCYSSCARDLKRLVPQLRYRRPKRVGVAA